MLRYRRQGQSFSADEISEKLKLARAQRGEGQRIHEIARLIGVTDTTYYNWQKRSQARQASGDAGLNRLRRENARLKRAVGSLAVAAGLATARNWKS